MSCLCPQVHFQRVSPERAASSSEHPPGAGITLSSHQHSSIGKTKVAESLLGRQGNEPKDDGRISQRLPPSFTRGACASRDVKKLAARSPARLLAPRGLPGTACGSLSPGSSSLHCLFSLEFWEAPTQTRETGCVKKRTCAPRKAKNPFCVLDDSQLFTMKTKPKAS